MIKVEAYTNIAANTRIDKDHLILIEDLHPNLYFIKIDDKNATPEKTIPFAETDKKKFDIEDVTYVNNMVYALWSQGTIKAFQFIDKDLMPQPEGICFSPEGELYISSEGKKGEAWKLFEFDASSN